MPIPVRTYPSCIQYETVTVPDISASDFGGEDAVRNFLINFQGAAVCLTPDSHISSTLRLFGGIHAVTDELVLQSHAGDLYLTPIYSRDEVIRDRAVIPDFAFPDSGRDFSRDISDMPPYSVDLGSIFPYGAAFSPDDLRAFFRDLLPRLRPAPSVTLTGDVPLIPLFLSALFLREAADGLRYEGEEAIQIFSV